MALQPGYKLGPYEILALMGKGGMGEVYRARDPRLDRIVAIKVSAAQFSERFEREAKAIGALNHNNVCQIYDVGPNYLVMEFVEGAPLKGPLPVEQALKYAVQICDALEAAHKKNITHRDLKPANILVTASGVKLLDFGLAKFTQSKAAPSGASLGPRDATLTMGLTEAGMVLGTAAYMSPEQAKAQDVDSRSDVFSFGLVLYEMLSGRRGFARDSAIETMAAIVRDEPPPLDVPSNLSAVVARCLRKLPADRFQSAAELRAALEAAAVAKPAEKAPSIAVLPFANMSADKENEYFGDGLAEEILNLLAKIPGLKVIARTSSFSFRGKELDIRKIAETLGVSHVLEGSVRRLGNRLRVAAQLIQASDGAHLWSERYDRDMTDVFALQDEIANAIASELKVSLTARKLVKVPTTHFAAYEALLQGRYHFLRFDPADQTKALACFERAVAIDPAYAAAHMGIALNHWGQMVVGMADPRQAMQRSVVAVREALRLDPANSEAHHTLASYYALNDFDWVKAERQFDRALELNPDSVFAYHCKTIYLLCPLGRLEEAVECQKLALAIDPLSLPVLVNFALALEGLHREEAEAQVIDRVNQMDPNFVGGQWFLVRLRARQGRVAEAVELAERLVHTAGRWGMTLGALGAAYAAAGSVDAARDVIAELGLDHNRQSRAFYSFLIAAALNDRDAAFRWAAESIEHRDPIMLSFIWSSSFDALRSDTRFAGLLNTLKIEDRGLAAASRVD